MSSGIFMLRGVSPKAARSHVLSNSCCKYDFYLDYINWKWNSNHIKTFNTNKQTGWFKRRFGVHAGGCDRAWKNKKNYAFVLFIDEYFSAELSYRNNMKSTKLFCR